MRTALVTGAAGQDGSYLCERLVAEGLNVHAVVESTTRVADQPWLRGTTVHEADLRNPERVRHLVDATAPDEVYNLAGISSVGRSWDEPVLTTEVNCLVVVALLDAVRRLQERRGVATRLVQAASAEIFGSAAVSPQDEATPLAPVNPYGVTKVFAHTMAGVYRALGVGASSCVLYNHESPRRPEAFVTRKITAAAARIAAGRQDVLELGSLNTRRDWGWAPDYVDAMVRAARHPEAVDVVVATGVTHTIEEFVAAAFAAAGVEDWSARVRLEPALVRPADTAEQRGDPNRARKLLGWTPTVGFGEMVARMVEADERRL